MVILLCYLHLQNMLKLQRKWHQDEVTFGFYDNVPEKTRANFRDAYKELNNLLSNIKFRETTYVEADSKIRVWQPPKGKNWLAWAYYPVSGDIGLSQKYLKDWERGLRKDTVYHEVGHSIGFAHTFSHKELLEDPLHDSRRYSVMAYKHRHEAATFQAVDIQSFRNVYGTKPSNTGNNMYVFKDWIGKCIVDDGGTDTLDFRGVDEKIANEMIEMLKEEPDGRHLSLAMSTNKWVSKLDSTTFEFAILPNGQKISLLPDAGPSPKKQSEISPIFATGSDKINHVPEFESVEMQNRCVILSPITRKGVQQATGIVQSVEPSGFTMLAKEPKRLDGKHAKENVSFTVLNIGQYDKTKIEVITTDAKRIKLKQPKKYVWAQVQNKDSFNYCVYDDGKLTIVCEDESGPYDVAIVQSDFEDFLPYPALQADTYWRYHRGELVDGRA